ncbi:DNA phosphorothioation-associated DGQHR protein 1 [Brevundimonas sp.]|jgi:DNA phosphorothioation-associated DGQHR protein 1|uniref:DNA phosphorothioation-associated DGQHR protein 1 n=1 Tax=Brevundimonas sp. TaxID=1871086 RepID=UPI0037BE2B5D
MYPFKTKALRVEQPLGEFYVAIIPAHILIDVAFSDRLRARIEDEEIGYSVSGTQREKQSSRRTQISDYINRSDAAFPNSIILAANYDEATGVIRGQDTEEGGRDDAVWSVVELDEGCFELTIPTAEKLAGIIDGQHRLDGFQQASTQGRRDMELICSVFMALPKPYQAQLFATINSTQKPVDKSLTYEMFGYNISDEPVERWTPDKLAVYLTRRLNTLDGSPLQGRIVVAPKRDSALKALAERRDWQVSTATVVEGILRLISSNPKRDANLMLTPPLKTRSALRDGSRDRSPMREVFIAGQDALLYATVLNYLKVCDTLFWSEARPGSFIVKTVGVQALFDILRKLTLEAASEGDVSEAFFARRLEPAGGIDFSSLEFQNASGTGRSIIRRAIEGAVGGL